MARCKNMVSNTTESGLPRAIFTRKAVCVTCGLGMQSSNMARHRRVKHPTSELLSGRTTPVSSPKMFVSPLRLNLKVRLPAVTKALSDRMEIEATVGEVTPCDLPPTPTSDEELQWELARLYSKRLGRSTSSTVGYTLTRDIAAVARNPEQREDFCAILETVGLVCLTKEELERRLEEATKKDQECQAKPERLVPSSYIIPPLVMADASFGLKITPFRMNC